MAKLKRPAFFETGRLNADWWLSCGVCGTHEYFDAPTTRRLHTERLARKAGWREFSIEWGIGGWVCPRCMSKSGTETDKK